MSQFYQGVTAGALPPSVPLQFTTDAGIATPAANNLNVLGGTGATTSGSGSTITVTVKNDGFDWSEKNGDFAASVQNGYFCNVALTATLPATAGIILGNSVIIYVDTTAVIVVQANTGQFIQVGSSISGASGTATCAINQKGSILELIFKPSDLTWHMISSAGTWTTV
jgi:hypothetical protein